MIKLYIIAVLIILLNREKLVIYHKFYKIVNSSTRFRNKLGKTLKILKIDKQEYGLNIKLELPYSFTFTNFKNDIDIFKEALEIDRLQVENKGNIVNMYLMDKYKFKSYEPIILPGNKLLIADSIKGPIIADMEKFPHVLLGGVTGSGKTRILLAIITNLIKNNNADIHLLQVRKNDLGVFKNCKQVKSFSNTLEEVLDALKNIDIECRKRESLIDNTKGYYSISDYNKANKGYKSLKFIYVVIEEFSFLNVNRGDTKEEKQIKAACLKIIKSIVNVGRSSGVFLITSLQRPTNDSIPTDIKSQLCTRISLLIKDSAEAKVILGNTDNTKLGEREVIVSTLDQVQGFSFTIDHNIIMDNIKDFIVDKTVDKDIKNNVIDISKHREVTNNNDLLEVVKRIGRGDL